jgi:hypothetical protein
MEWMELKNAHNIVAVKPLNETDVEVRYGDGSPPLVIKNTTTSTVMKAVSKAKSREFGTDSP